MFTSLEEEEVVVAEAAHCGEGVGLCLPVPDARAEVAGPMDEVTVRVL